jgi:hypothetical protein
VLRINVAYNRQWLPIIRNNCNASAPASEENFSVGVQLVQAVGG